MATIVFQAAGAAIGGMFGPVGAMIGRAAGALAGSMVDRALMAPTRTISGARLATARIPGADDGTAINRLYGTARIGGTLIWATRFEEEATVERAGGKAGGGARTQSFRYFASFAIGLCEGEIAGVRRIWADGREIDLTGIDMRVYHGSLDQLPDPLIEAKQGTGHAPAYRGLAYAVFERLPLDGFGNRIPLLHFEVIRPVGTLEGQVRALTLIPGATEHGYATTQATEKTGAGSARIMNRHTLAASTDWETSIDEMIAVFPNLKRVALVVSWFGTDLRAGQCRVLPGVEAPSRRDEKPAWSVAGLTRDTAHPISLIDGSPAYGGTPDDASVRQAIADLKARGLKVYLYPFLMMDVPPGNALPDPYGGHAQAPFPWRGRMTCHPAPGRPGSPDRSAQVDADIDAFTHGKDGYRRLVMHYAELAAKAGGVDGFIIGSELRGLTRLRGGDGGFPFVRELVRLASDVRATLGPAAKLTYAADWSEYFGYHPPDGTGDVFFHLDPLWASDAIDAVGIDNYMPLSDWRDGDVSAAQPDGFRIADDSRALASQIARGEGFDWYYASDADRENRVRSPITDGMAGKPWVYRYKDIHGWWANRHFERIGGAERAQPTGWRPGMKPIWFTELGCPAIDKGANQPNVFVDPKSVESFTPYFSTGNRSDAAQRRFLEAQHGYWQGAQAPAGMVDPAHIFVWTWDARPYPAFPQHISVWSDGDNWRTGHWLNGRAGAGTLADIIAAILADHGFEDFDVSQVSGDLNGYVQGEVTAARNLLEPLIEVFGIDVIERNGRLAFRSRALASLPAKEVSVLADQEDEALWSENRGHDGDFATEAVLTAYNPMLDYEQASVRSRKARSGANRVLRYDLPAVLPQEAALHAVDEALRAHRMAKRTVSFTLSPAELSLETGDAIHLSGGPAGTFLVTRIEDGATRRVEAREYAAATATARRSVETVVKPPVATPSSVFQPVMHFLDLPRYRAGAQTDFACAAVTATPWRRVALSSSATEEGYRLRRLVERPARTGALTRPAGGGVTGRFDHATTLDIELYFGGLSSVEPQGVLNGANRAAMLSRNGEWEILAFAHTVETGPGRWRLTGLLRGLAGTEDAMAAGAGAGAAFVILDDAVVALGLDEEERGLRLNWTAAQVGDVSGMAGPVGFSGGMRVHMPLAPVHLRGTRMAGDAAIRFSWIRRSRLDADDWDATDIAMDEDREEYRIEILDGTQIIRSAEVAAPHFLYGAAEERSDFGVAQTAIRIRVRQMGRRVPVGIAAQATITL